METLIKLFDSFWYIWLDAAFWILIGLICAGLLQTFLKHDKLSHYLRGHGMGAATKAALLGMPLPLCSCGVIPAAIGLRRAGASKSATTAFLISTPETGVDSIVMSYALLGPVMAVIRPIAALCSAMVAAFLVMMGEQRTVLNNSCTTDARSQDTHRIKTAEQSANACCDEKVASHQATSCCQSNATTTHATASAPCLSTPDSAQMEHGTRCCTPTTSDNETLGVRLWRGQQYAFSTLFGDLSLWLLVGLGASAVVMTYVPHHALSAMTQGPMAMLVMAVIGIPMYICASASTPLAAGFLLAGVSPGAVLVFLLAGPATNIATLGLVRQELGMRALLCYLVGVVGVAFGFGIMTNFMIEQWHYDIVQAISEPDHFIPQWLTILAAFILAGVVLRDLIHRIYRRIQGIHIATSRS